MILVKYLHNPAKMQFIVNTKKNDPTLMDNEIYVHVKKNDIEYEHKFDWRLFSSDTNLHIETMVNMIVNSLIDQSISIYSEIMVIDIIYDININSSKRINIAIPVKKNDASKVNEVSKLNNDQIEISKDMKLYLDKMKKDIIAELKNDYKPNIVKQITIEDIKFYLNVMKKDIITELKNELPKPLDYNLIDTHNLKDLTKCINMKELSQHVIWHYYATVLMEYHLSGPTTTLYSEERNLVDDRTYVNVDNLVRTKLPKNASLQEVMKPKHTLGNSKSYYLLNEGNKYIDMVSNGNCTRVHNVIASYGLNGFNKNIEIKLSWLIAGYLVGYFLHNPKLMFEYDMKVILFCKDKKVDRIEFRGYPFKKIDICQHYEFDLENEKYELIKYVMEFGFEVIEE